MLISPPDLGEGDEDAAAAKQHVAAFWEQMMKRYGNESKYQKDLTSRFKSADDPEIIIVVDKLLTGFDAPRNAVLYLTRSLKDHKLLQAIARVNRPYENEQAEMVKPHGFVLDFVGIFDKLEKALAFDSEEINAIVKDLKLLKVLFQNKMEQQAPGYLALIERNFDDKDVDALIEHIVAAPDHAGHTMADKVSKNPRYCCFRPQNLHHSAADPDKPFHHLRPHAVGGCKRDGEVR